MMQAVTKTIHSWVNGFVEYYPDAWDKKKRIPAVVFIHGIGEVGTDLNKYQTVGLPNTIKNFGFPQEAVVFMPQFNRAYPGGFTVQAMIDYVLANYAVDPTRIYLTGLSMGGAAVIDWAETGKPETVAAMAPICPISIYQPFGLKYVAANMPIWFTHNDGDPQVSINNSLSWVNNLNSQKINPPTRITSPKLADHNAWDRAYNPATTDYDGGNLWSWMFKQSKGTVVQPPVVTPPAPTMEAEFSFPGGKYTLLSDKTWIKS